MKNARLEFLYQKLINQKIDINNYLPGTDLFDIAFDLISLETAIAGISDKVFSTNRLSEMEKKILRTDLMVANNVISLNGKSYNISNYHELYIFSDLLREMTNELLRLISHSSQ